MENKQFISSAVLSDMFISAANAIESRKNEVNELNVFPVPDGDTGTNMSMTMASAKKALLSVRPQTVGEVAETAASSLLRGARGNSGVILSLLFRGVAGALKYKTEASGEDFITAFAAGVEAAYKAVMKPAEGTILTVAREAAEACALLPGEEKADCLKVFETTVAQAEKTLARTPEMLPVLKKAGVVDSGGKGLVIIFGAMLAALKGSAVTEAPSEPAGAEPAAPADSDEDIRFAYCTEFIINKEGPDGKDPLALRAYLESMGDSVLVADGNNFIKVHLHTNTPDRAIAEALTYGYLTDIKIDNMRVQHQNRIKAAANSITKPFGIVAVSAGEGISRLFTDLGADVIVEGGQTMNPSTDDILHAIDETGAESVFVLPNNKNIILAAEQAVSLSDRKVSVLHTKTIPQGISAMLSFDPESDSDSNLISMNAAAENVKTGLITFAARDSDFDGRNIKKDEIMALDEGKLAFTETDAVKAAYKLARQLTDKTTSCITVIYGRDISREDAERLKTQIEEKFGQQADITLVDGGQPVYYFILSVE